MKKGDALKASPLEDEDCRDPLTLTTRVSVSCLSGDDDL